MKKLWFIVVLLVACKTESQMEPEPPSETGPKYETYGYAGFTKEEKQAYHKHLLEGGSRRYGGDHSRFYFLNYAELEKHSRILRSDTPKILEETPRADVQNFLTPKHLKTGGGLPLTKYIKQAEVDGLIIVHKGKIVFEGYPRMFPTDFHVNYSVTKIYVSTAVGILEDRGLLDSRQPIDTYLEALKGSDWEGIPIVDILAMSSGMESGSSSQKLRTAYTTQEQIKALASAKSVKPSGTEYDYRGINTAMLTLLVEEVSGLTFSDFLEQEIWRKIGSEFNGLLGKRSNGLAATSSYGVSSTLRDLARFGLAYTPSGRKGSNPIVSDAHLARIRDVNKNLKAKSWFSEDIKYPGHQWDEIYEDGDFYKGGHAGQGLYISPSRDLVIAFYGTYDVNKKEHQLPAISRQLAKSGLFDLE
ncbi:serine hydrolase domain-containing protein [Flagellimonas allohymeniacidonis]|uniref:Class A beta-lactamase-related serine hydrolase n=1 Tax=Flagellimonas allohymeniacidonis TaxID=2517819 RepID=A0A4Q8QGT4_9FLAO|nr:serine hydrolase domain-containing protein [Allomuricauda hymeniacidonis]TAI47599.1 class A beta-lactamase-related serine hydrolase [Allomuricauda hymeniacidonis]